MSPIVGMFSRNFFLAVSFLQVLFLIICHMGIVLPASDIHFYIIPFFFFCKYKYTYSSYHFEALQACSRFSLYALNKHNNTFTNSLVSLGNYLSS